MLQKSQELTERSTDPLHNHSVPPRQGVSLQPKPSNEIEHADEHRVRSSGTRDLDWLMARCAPAHAGSAIRIYEADARRPAQAKERLIILDGFFDNGLDGFTIVSRGGSGCRAFVLNRRIRVIRDTRLASIFLVA